MRLNDVTADNIEILSGATDSIHLNNVTATSLLVKAANNAVRVVTEGTTAIGNTTVESGAKLEVTAGSFGEIELAPSTPENIELVGITEEDSITITSEVTVISETLIKPIIIDGVKVVVKDTEDATGVIVIGDGNETTLDPAIKVKVTKVVAESTDDGDKLAITLSDIPGETPTALSVNVTRTINGENDSSFIFEGGESLWAVGDKVFTIIEIKAVEPTDTDQEVIYSVAHKDTPETIVASNPITVAAEIEEPTEVANVTNFDDLKAAIESSVVTTINIMSDIDVTEKLQILSEKHINGNDNTLTANDGNGWNRFYVLQFYKTTGSVKDIAITGGDAAIYVNGSTVTLEGTVDVSGNEFGGIEVSQGTDVTEVPKLTVDGTLVFDDEETPAIWIDGKTTNDDWVVVEGLHEVEKSDDSQLWFVTTKPEEPDPLEVINNADNEDALKDALNTAKIKNVFDDVDYLDNFDENIATLEAVQGLVDRTNAAWAIITATFEDNILTVEINETISPDELEVDNSLNKYEFKVEAASLTGEDLAELLNIEGLSFENAEVAFDNNTWIINFGDDSAITDLLDGVKFYLAVTDGEGNVYGSMYNGGYFRAN